MNPYLSFTFYIPQESCLFKPDFGNVAVVSDCRATICNAKDISFWSTNPGSPFFSLI